MPCMKREFAPHLEYPRITLSEMLHQTAAKYPQHISMIHLDYKWTYTKLNEMASQMANLLIARGFAQAMP